tara:strand:- start:8700 stop:8927 length:228 start_codon:yes stop_codon:yes gene_type:complete
MLVTDVDARCKTPGEFTKLQVMQHLECGGMVVVVWQLPEDMDVELTQDSLTCTNCDDTFSVNIKGNASNGLREPT